MVLTVPFHRPCIGDSEIMEVVRTLQSGWLTMGKKTLQFEDMIAEEAGTDHAIAVNSCTAALHLSLLAHGIGPDDEVITTPYTFIATSNVIVHAGARPVFVDVDPRTYNIDPEKIVQAITKKTRAIMPVHFAGTQCNMKAINQIADDHNLVVIEDAAHAIGGEYADKTPVGSSGNATCFSFYATKNMTTGEGGAVVTNEKGIADKIRRLRLHGMDKDAWKRYDANGSWYYEVTDCGWKYNMTDLNAAIGLHQLERLPFMTSCRVAVAEYYIKKLQNIKGLTAPLRTPGSVFHLFPLQVFGKDRAQFISRMNDLGVQCSVHFLPVHMHPYYHKTFGTEATDCPNAGTLYLNEVSLPIFPDMTHDESKLVVDAVRAVMEEET